MEISLSKGFKFVIFILEKYIEPSLGFKKPDNKLNKVDFPEPLLPITPTN